MRRSSSAERQLRAATPAWRWSRPRSRWSAPLRLRRTARPTGYSPGAVWRGPLLLLSSCEWTYPVHAEEGVREALEHGCRLVAQRLLGVLDPPQGHQLGLHGCASHTGQPSLSL